MSQITRDDLIDKLRDGRESNILFHSSEDAVGKAIEVALDWANKNNVTDLDRVVDEVVTIAHKPDVSPSNVSNEGIILSPIEQVEAQYHGTIFNNDLHDEEYNP